MAEVPHRSLNGAFRGDLEPGVSMGSDPGCSRDAPLLVEGKAVVTAPYD